MWGKSKEKKGEIKKELYSKNLASLHQEVEIAAEVIKFYKNILFGRCADSAAVFFLYVLFISLIAASICCSLYPIYFEFVDIIENGSSLPFLVFLLEDEQFRWVNWTYHGRLKNRSIHKIYPNQKDKRFSIEEHQNQKKSIPGSPRFHLQTKIYILLTNSPILVSNREETY